MASNSIQIISTLTLFICFICNCFAFMYVSPIFQRHFTVSALTTPINQATQTVENKLLEVTLNVKDISASKNFYTSVLGMEIINEESDKIKLSYSVDHAMQLELIQNKDTVIGDAFVGIGIKSPDALVKFSLATALGANVVMPFDEYSFGACVVPDEDEKIVNPISYGKLTDPDGYIVELIEGESRDPFCKIILNVLDLNDSVNYYTDKLKMNLLRRRANVNNRPRSASMCAYVGYGPEDTTTYIELIYKYATESINMGTGLNYISIKSSENSALVKDPDNYNIKLI